MMKVCLNCGAEVNDQREFCSNCGAKSPVPDLDSKDLKKKPKRKNVILAVLAGVLVVVVASAVIFFVWYSSGEQRMKRALEAGDYEEALAVIKEDFSLRNEESVVDMLTERLAELKQAYLEEDVEYSAVTAELDTIEKMKVEAVLDEVQALREFSSEINGSRTHFSIAEEFSVSGDYQEAMDHYKQVIKDDPNYQSAQEKLQQATEAYRQGVLEEAEGYVQNGEYATAILVLDNALSVLPEDSQITEKIALYEKEKADQEKADVLATAERYAMDGDYSGAIVVIENYLEDKPGDPEAIKKLDSYRKANEEKIREDALEESSSFAENGDFLSAIDVLEDYINTYGKHTEITIAYNDYKNQYVVSTLAEAEDLAATEDYSGALEIIRLAQNNVQDDRFDKKLSSYETVYVAKMIEASDALLDQKEYDQALDMIEHALEVLPGNSELQTQIQKIDASRPKYLLDVHKPYESGGYEEYTDGRTFMMSSEMYSNGFTLVEHDSYVYFNIGGRYEKLSMILGHVDGTNLESTLVKIFFDGILVQEIDFSGSRMPIVLELDINDVQQIKIECPRDNGWYPVVGFAEVTVQ